MKCVCSPRKPQVTRGEWFVSSGSRATARKLQVLQLLLLEEPAASCVMPYVTVRVRSQLAVLQNKLRSGWEEVGAAVAGAHLLYQHVCSSTASKKN